MKKLFKRLATLGLLSGVMLSATMLPGYAQEPFIFDRQLTDSYGSEFYTGLYIYRTDEVFNGAQFECEMDTYQLVISDAELYQNSYVAVVRDTGTQRASYDTFFQGYLFPNEIYDLPSGEVVIPDTQITKYIRGWGCFSLREYDGVSVTRPGGYYNPKTGVTYEWEVRKTRDEIIKHGLDYLN